MVQAIRAIYESGQLRLLDPVDLSEGQEINIAIVSTHQEMVRKTLSDLLVTTVDTNNDEIDEAALMHEIEEGFRGEPPLSETILQERREGP